MNRTPDHITNKHFTLLDLLEFHTEQHPNKVIYKFINEMGIINQITYQELMFQAHSISQYIQETTKSGDRILLIFGPGLDFIKAFFGVIISRRIAVPVYPPIKPEYVRSLQSIILDCKPSLIMSNTEIISKIRQLKFIKKMSSVPLVNSIIEKLTKVTPQMLEWSFDSLTWISINAIPLVNQVNQKNNIKPHDFALLQYTSGSTGNPKGVCVSHDNLYQNQVIIQKGFNTDKEIGVVSWLPFYHDMGLIGAVLHPCYLGTYSILMSPVSFLKSPFNWLKTISATQNCASGGPNFCYNLCTSRISEEQKQELDLSNWKIAFCGAEPIQRKIMDEFADYFESCGFNRSSFFPCYGLAEGTLFVSGKYNLSSLQENELQSVAKDHKLNKDLISTGQMYQDVKIIDTTYSKILGESEIGEVAIAGPSVTTGYWNKDLNSDLFIILENKQYLLTGDLGFIKNNELYICGRKKEILIIAGKNYFPQDMEYELYHNISNLKKGCVAVVGIEHESTERVYVIAEIKADCEDHQQTTMSIRNTLAKYFKIAVDTVILISEKNLPKTSSGKIKRVQLKNSILNETLSMVYLDKKNAVFPDKSQHPLVSIIRDLLGISSDEFLDTSKTLSDLGIDSLLYVELQVRFEESFPEFKGKINFQELAELNNLEEALVRLPIN